MTAADAYANRAGVCRDFAHLAITMCRALSIPARYVVGYLPGKLLEDKQTRVVERSAAHAWVEVFFPGYGWYPFDPTPGLTEQGQEITVIPTGAPRATAPPEAPDETPYFGPSFDDQGELPNTVTNPPSRGGGPSPIVALAVGILVLAAALVLVVSAARRRRVGPGAQMTYDSVARMASRLGYGPLPSQTTYEYADRLSTVVPQVRDEIQIVATAKVEALYARREPSEELRLLVARAYRRVRMSLLRLFVRRPRWLSLPGAKPRRPGSTPENL
jgi:hypothetical protein